MPLVYAQIHDNLIQNFIEKFDEMYLEEEKIKSKEFKIYPLNNLGYMVPCSRIVKLLPNLEKGL